jgi:hypothetical protein
MKRVTSSGASSTVSSSALVLPSDQAALRAAAPELDPRSAATAQSSSLGSCITPEMIEAGEQTILETVGGADLGGYFSASLLATQIYVAMERQRIEPSPSRPQSFGDIELGRAKA